MNFLFFVGAAGFEPATSCSQSRRDKPGYATPRILFYLFYYIIRFPFTNALSLFLSATTFPIQSGRDKPGYATPRILFYLFYYIIRFPFTNALSLFLSATTFPIQSGRHKPGYATPRKLIKTGF
jgi:hypothetical protein